MELMCEKVIASAGQHLSPGDALRRVFEALASGLLLPGSPGLLDPCEKDPIDAASPLSAQEREDITASAQVNLQYTSHCFQLLPLCMFRTVVPKPMAVTQMRVAEPTVKPHAHVNLCF